MKSGDVKTHRTGHLGLLASSSSVTFHLRCYNNLLIILFTETNGIVDEDTVFLSNLAFKISGIKCFKANSRGQEVSWQHKKTCWQWQSAELLKLSQIWGLFSLRYCHMKGNFLLFRFLVRTISFTRGWVC